MELCKQYLVTDMLARIIARWSATLVALMASRHNDWYLCQFRNNSWFWCDYFHQCLHKKWLLLLYSSQTKNKLSWHYLLSLRKPRAKHGSVNTLLSIWLWSWWLDLCEGPWGYLWKNSHVDIIRPIRHVFQHPMGTYISMKIHKVKCLH